MPRAYQSPCSGMDCGSQWAQAPNFASRHHSGTTYFSLIAFQSAVYGPAATFSSGKFQMSGGNPKSPSPTVICSILTPTSPSLRLMVTVPPAGITSWILAFRKDLVASPEEWTFTWRAGPPSTVTLIVPTSTDA